MATSIARSYVAKGSPKTKCSRRYGSMVSTTSVSASSPFSKSTAHSAWPQTLESRQRRELRRQNYWNRNDVDPRAVFCAETEESQRPRLLAWNAEGHRKVVPRKG